LTYVLIIVDIKYQISNQLVLIEKIYTGFVEKAAIHQGTKYEISWTEDEPVTPHLVNKIRESGNELEINWLDSPFTTAVELLLDQFDKEDIRTRLYDEDPELIDTISIIIQSPLSDDKNNSKKLTRLYLPIIIILLDEIAP
jgi:hypothetical protein